MADSRYSFIHDFGASPSLAFSSPGQSSKKSPSLSSLQSPKASAEMANGYAFPFRREHNATVRFTTMESTLPIAGHHWLLANTYDEARPVPGPSAWTIPGPGMSPPRRPPIQSRSEPALPAKKESRLKRLVSRVAAAISKLKLRGGKNKKGKSRALVISNPTLIATSQDFAKMLVAGEDGSIVGVTGSNDTLEGGGGFVFGRRGSDG